jgi:hypothetical protein
VLPLFLSQTKPPGEPKRKVNPGSPGVVAEGRIDSAHIEPRGGQGGTTAGGVQPCGETRPHGKSCYSQGIRSVIRCGTALFIFSGVVGSGSFKDVKVWRICIDNNLRLLIIINCQL